jgi:hypothetical protein
VSARLDYRKKLVLHFDSGQEPHGSGEVCFLMCHATHSQVEPLLLKNPLIISQIEVLSGLGVEFLGKSSLMCQFAFISVGAAQAD